MGDLFPGFKTKGAEESQRIPPALAVSPVVLIQSNQHASVAHFGAACPWFLHRHLRPNTCKTELYSPKFAPSQPMVPNPVS